MILSRLRKLEAGGPSIPDQAAADVGFQRKGEDVTLECPICSRAQTNMLLALHFC